MLVMFHFVYCSTKLRPDTSVVLSFDFTTLFTEEN